MNKAFKLCLCLLIYMTLTGCSKDTVYTVVPDDVEIKSKSIDYEIYNQVWIKDIVDVTNAEVIDNMIELTKIGSNDIVFNYEYNNKKYEAVVNINVKDTVAPKIFGNSSMTLEVGSDIDLCEVLKTGDNYTKRPTCRIEGEYDLSTKGSYKIKYIVEDEAGNQSILEQTLNIVDKINSTSNSYTPSKVKFSDVYEKYKDEYEIGLDISAWQGGDIDFNKIKDAGASFVILRLGVKVERDKDVYLDKYFETNYEKAKEAGLKIGVYVYSKAINIDDALEDSKFVINNLYGKTIDLGVAFDFEEWGDWNKYNMSFYDLNKVATTFIDRVESYGYKGYIYGSKYYLENFYDINNFANIWLAHYTNNTTFNHYKIWQFTNSGLIDGIYGDVDLNLMKKDADVS